uniref:LIM zinc-binding domain-containing protein n=1 Tax=Manihot esculenta TaxID=3983 RepID=A0A2C9WI84_MANES
MFTGTTEKCKACDQTVHFFETVKADGVPYHKKCFKCSHCNGLLVMSSYSSVDGALYCKPHFDQLFRARAPSRLSSMFRGTQDKCASCDKTAYPLEKVTVEGASYHKTCFRCSHGGCYLTPSSYAALDGILYCKPHFAQLFKEKGCYNHLTKSASTKRSEAIAPEAEESKVTAAVSEPNPEVETEGSSEATPVKDQ